MCVTWPDASIVPSALIAIAVTRSVCACRKTWSLLSCTLRMTMLEPSG